MNYEMILAYPKRKLIKKILRHKVNRNQIGFI